MARDSQKSRLYAAEKDFKTGLDPKFRTVEQVEAYLCQIMSTRWWAARYPDVGYIQVKDGRGARIARGSREGRFIKLPLWARNKHVILHEVAHVLTDDHHGPKYAQAYYDLLLRFCGPEDADHFLAGCIEHRVRIGQRRPSFKTDRYTPEGVILATGVERLPIWASEDTVFFEVAPGLRYFQKAQDAQRWRTTYLKAHPTREAEITKCVWHKDLGWIVDREYEEYIPSLKAAA